MSDFDFEFFVIGAGSGGVRAARMAAQKGIKTAVVEMSALGGTCVNVGCVPKKLFSYASHYSEDFEDAAGYGWQLAEQPGFNWPTLRDNKTREIERLNGIYQRLLENAGVELKTGRAQITGPNQVAVGDKTFTAKHILVATGGKPYIPEFEGSNLVRCSDDLFYLEQFPESALVVGGGYIAVEFAGILNGLGVATELVYRREKLLRGFDEDVRDFIGAEMAKKGIELRFNDEPAVIKANEAGGYQVVFESGVQASFDEIFYATGRVANTLGLGLEKVGVRLNERGAIEVDEDFKTSVPSIYALGDVIDRVQLTPVAIAEAMVLVENLFGAGSASMDYELIPTAVFCQPNIGTVGLTEAEARESYDEVVIYRSNFKPMKYILTSRDERCLMKLVVDGKTDRVLGAHMVGGDAGEIVQGIAIALKAGATKTDFDRTIGIHPTAAEEFVTMRTPV